MGEWSVIKDRRAGITAIVRFVLFLATSCRLLAG